METKSSLNPILQKELENIDSPITKEICQLAIESARKAFEKNIGKPDEYVYNQVNRKINKITKKSQR